MSASEDGGGQGGDRVEEWQHETDEKQQTASGVWDEMKR